MADEVRKPKKILVVDDEPDLQPLILQRMRRHIRRGKYEFVFASNGVEALDCLRRDSDIDMVLSDINMPQMDGLTLLDQIPKVDPHVRAVIVSAYGDMENIRTAMNRGAFDFVTKPLDFKDLQVTIDRTLSHLTEWRSVLVARDQLVAIQNELSIASQIQQSILPTSYPENPAYTIWAYMEPARNVGGDFYDVVKLEGERIGLVVADVSDKGVPAALFMMACRTLLKGAAIGHYDPGKSLESVNALLLETNDANMFVTVLYAMVNPDSGEFHYANGGHNPPVVVHADGTSSLLPLTNGVALGIVPDFEYESHSIRLQPGDTVFFYTDGIPEAINENEEEFGMERLCASLESIKEHDARHITEHILSAVKEFAGDVPQFDDITCLTFCYHGNR